MHRSFVAKSRHVVVALALALLSACATGQHPRVPDTQFPLSYDAAARNALPPAVLDTWWLQYADPQLDALIQRAQLHGFDARQALARLDEAQAIRDGALSRFNPQGDIQGSGEVRQTNDLDNDSAQPGISRSRQTRVASLTLPVSWELDLFGRRSVAQRAADADMASARFDYEAANAALVAELARTLFRARGLVVQADEAQAVARINRALLEVLTRRVERGLAASSDADRVGADLAQAEAETIGLEAELKATRRALLVLVGDGLAPLSSLQVSGDIDRVPEIPTVMPGDLLERRPDIRRADARVRAAAGYTRLAELDFFPRLTLNPGVGLNKQSGGLDSTTSFWSLGLGLMVPVLDRQRLTSVLNVESARGQQSVIAYEATVQTAFSETDQALTRLASARQRVQILTEGDARARRSYEAAKKRFDLGFADLQELFDAERVWRATRSALTGSRVDALLRSVQAFQALGGGWPASETPLDASDEG